MRGPIEIYCTGTYPTHGQWMDRKSMNFDYRYVRADIADEHLAWQRDRLIAAAKALHHAIDNEYEVDCVDGRIRREYLRRPSWRARGRTDSLRSGRRMRGRLNNGLFSPIA